MAIKLPRLTWQLDCAPMGYPGVVVEFWLNPPALGDDEVKHLGDDIYASLARIIERITVPGAYTDSGQAETVEIGGDRRVLRDLDRGAGFDPQLLIWASFQYRNQRVARLEAEAKN